MLPNPKRSYVQRRLFSADHVSNQLPGNQTEVDEEPAMPLFFIGRETCSEYDSSTARHHVRRNAARIECAWDSQSTNYEESAYGRKLIVRILSSCCFERPLSAIPAGRRYQRLREIDAPPFADLELC